MALLTVCQHTFQSVTAYEEAVEDVAISKSHPARREVLRVTEALDVTQGKLGMGFTCGS